MSTDTIQHKQKVAGNVLVAMAAVIFTTVVIVIVVAYSTGKLSTAARLNAEVVNCRARYASETISNTNHGVRSIIASVLSGQIPLTPEIEQELREAYQASASAANKYKEATELSANDPEKFLEEYC